MGKKRHLDHQITDNNNLHSDHNRGGGNKKRSSSEESQLLHKLNTHLKKLSKTRSKMSPAAAVAGNDAIATVTSSMHAYNGGSPSCNSSTRVLDINDDHHHNQHQHVVAFKFNNNGQLLDYSNVCSGESSGGRSETTVTTSFVVATEIQELFGGDFTFAPDLNAAHSLVHLEFVDGAGFGLGYGFGSTFLSDPIAVGFAKYSTDMLKLSSLEDMIQEFLKNNLFD